jgi:anti-anti-sigma factor
VLNVIIEESGETVLLRCTGRIVRGDETALLCAAVGNYGRKIILDLSQVDAIDAAGVGALIALQAAGIYPRLMNPNKAIREVLQVTQLDSLFEVCSAPPAGSQKQQEDAPQMPAAAFPSPAVATAI